MKTDNTQVIINMQKQIDELTADRDRHKADAERLAKDLEEYGLESFRDKWEPSLKQHTDLIGGNNG